MAILTYGVDHMITYNIITDLDSVHSDECTGIYSKAQALSLGQSGLSIDHNTLTNAGGKEAMIVAKTGWDGEYGGLRANTWITFNTLNRTKFTGNYANRSVGILVYGNHANIQNNQLGNSTDADNGGNKIAVGSNGNQTGMDITIIGNNIWVPVDRRDEVNLNGGISAVMYGDDWQIENNFMEGVSQPAGPNATGIYLEANTCITQWTIFNNTINALTPASGSIGIHVRDGITSPGKLDGFNDATVEANNTFDSSVADKVLNTTTGTCP